MTSMEPPRVRPSLDPSANDPYLSALRERVLIYDGATGTNFQLAGPARRRLRRRRARGVQRDARRHQARRRRAAAPLVPGRRRRRHRDQLLRRVLGRARRVRHRRARARTRAGVGPDRAPGRRQYASPGSPRFVAGSMGPGTKFPSLGQITYDDLSASYEEMAYGLLEGGVDLLVVETIYDLLSGKAAIAACHRAMARHGRRRADPGPGDDRADRPDAARHRDRRRDHGAQSRSGVDVLGLNCATGPVEMYEPLRNLRDVLADAALVPARTRGCRASSRARCTTTSRRTRSPSTCRSSSRSTACRSSAAAAARRPQHLARVIEAVRPLTPRRARADARAGGRRRSTPRRTTNRTDRCCWSASAPTRTARRSSATRCSRATGTPASASAATRSKRARTSSTSASTTPAPTASRT